MKFHKGQRVRMKSEEQCKLLHMGLTWYVDWRFRTVWRDEHIIRTASAYDLFPYRLEGEKSLWPEYFFESIDPTLDEVFCGI